jgi:polyisoprenoid-binding protein YceI
MIRLSIHLNVHGRRSWIGWIIQAALMAGILFVASEPSARADNTTPQANPVTVLPTSSVANDQGLPLDLAISKGSFIELDGNATLSSWSSRSNDVDGKVLIATQLKTLDALFDQITADLKTGKAAPALKLNVDPTGDLILPVMSLHGGSNGMDHDLQTALDATGHPDIFYVFKRVTGVTVQSDPQSGSPEVLLQVQGDLTIAGQQRTVNIPTYVQCTDPDHFHVYSQTSILMSDYGITPPTAFFGLIRAHNQVSVIFDLEFAPATVPAPSTTQPR